MKHPYPALVRDLVTTPFMDNLELMKIPNKKGTTPKLFIDALNKIMCQEEQELSSSSDSSAEETWEEKLRHAYDEDVSEARGSFHNAEEEDTYRNCFNETYEEWADRIYAEFMKKKRPLPTSKKVEESDKTKSDKTQPKKLKLRKETNPSSSSSSKALCLKQLLESSEPITLERIPFTLQSTPESIVSVLMMGQNEQEIKCKKRLKEALRVWHPDKFFQKFNSRIKAEEKEDIQKLVNFISTVLLHY